MNIRLTHLNELVRICEDIHRKSLNTSLSSWRPYYAKGLFEKVTLHCRSITTLLESQRYNVENLDIAGVCSLSRCVIETHNAYIYLLEKGLTSDESEFRQHLLNLNKALDVKKINMQLGIDSQSMQNDFNDFFLQNSIADLTNNSIFKALDEKQKKPLLRGKNTYISKRYNGKRPIPHEVESAAYKLFSHAIHSYALGISPFSGGNLTPSGAKNMIILATEISIIYLSNIALHYWKLRSRAIKTLAISDREFLTNCTHSNYIDEWLRNIQKS